jgi:predicted flavoprotein YhiN
MPVDKDPAVKQIVVIGAGASGLMAAGRAAELGGRVLLLEKTERPGNKLRLSGGSGCNLTNAGDLEDFVPMYGPNGRFLYGAFRQSFRDDLLSLLSRYGVETETRPDGRIFPSSNRADDVVRALERYVSERGVRLIPRVRVTAIRAIRKRIAGVVTDGGGYPAAAVVLAAGGASYPETGSRGDGYELASTLGHKVVSLRPALVPLIVREAALARSMQGISLRHVRLTAYRCAAAEIDPLLAVSRDYGRGIGGRQPRHGIIESRTGDMVLTHFGISGPIVLLMSLAIVEALERGPASVSIDLFPDLDEGGLRRRLQDEFHRHGGRGIRHLLDGLLPHKTVDHFIRMAGITSDKLGGQVTAGERESLLRLLKSLKFNIQGPLPMASAMVTAGGVALEEIDPQTMASRLVKGLFLCGEVIDVDGGSGGYNLQAAFSTGYVAGEHACRTVLSRRE